MAKDEYDELGAIIEQHPIGRPRGCHLCAAREARVAQLEAALRALLPMVDCPEQFSGAVDAARAALAASPDDAGRRWEAMREVCKAARAYCADDGFQGDLCDALARLDAEGK